MALIVGGSNPRLRSLFVFTPTTSVNVISGPDSRGAVLTYTPGETLVDVIINGVNLAPADYIATNGSSITLGTYVGAGDTIIIVAYQAVDIANTYSQATADGRFVQKTAQDYSTSEIDTGQKWTDNKTIYRKVVNTGELPNNTTKNIAHGITGTFNIIEVQGIAKAADGNSLPLPYVNVNAVLHIQVYISATNISIVTAAAWTGSTSFIILEYTKG